MIHPAKKRLGPDSAGQITILKSVLNCPLEVVGGFHLTESVYKVILQKSIPAHIRQLVLYHE